MPQRSRESGGIGLSLFGQRPLEAFSGRDEERVFVVAGAELVRQAVPGITHAAVECGKEGVVVGHARAQDVMTTGAGGVISLSKR